MSRNNFDNKELLFLQSALTTQNPFTSTQEVIQWLKERNEQIEVEIKRIRFDQMTNWLFDPKETSLGHVSGKFFKIEGINVQTNWGEVPNWDQPIINQPEIGFLGILTKTFNGVLYFLMQAKIEPGNVNYVQLSPTLQATKSNYTQVHKGNKPLYLEYFLDREDNLVLLDQLQSEQGARFLKKRNRNIIIKVDGDVPNNDDFCWLTLGQIKELMQIDNLVNMDTRTVVSGIPYGNHQSETIDFYNIMNHSQNMSLNAKMLASELDKETALNSFDEIIYWFTNLKASYDLLVTPIKLVDVKDWKITDTSIIHKDEKYFQVIAVDVKISNREVKSWDQPLVEPAQQGLCAFIAKEINGRYHFLVQAKLESGNFDILELAPTVQCLTGSYESEKSLGSLPFLSYVLNAKPEQMIFDTLQSEEGGRFYQEQNRSMLITVDEDFPMEVPHNYIWITLNQLKTFIKFNNYLNIQARSLISAISYH